MEKAVTNTIEHLTFFSPHRIKNDAVTMISSSNFEKILMIPEETMDEEKNPFQASTRKQLIARKSMIRDQGWKNLIKNKKSTRN